jgi:hypothetical protein
VEQVKVNLPLSHLNNVSNIIHRRDNAYGIDKTRFRTAMERFYFPSVPDRWSKASPDDFPVEEETTTTT